MTKRIVEGSAEHAVDDFRRKKEKFLPLGRLFKSPGWCKTGGGSSEMVGILRGSIFREGDDEMTDT